MSLVTAIKNTQHVNSLLVAFLAVNVFAMTSYADMAAPPPPNVEVIEIKAEPIRVWSAFSGTLSAVDIAEIKPQVGGEITQVLFQDGQMVKKGQRLFVIDPRPYEAAYKRSQAQLASAQSRAKLAKDELERSKKLVASKLVSESLYDAALNDYNVAIAAINEAKSALVQTKLDLDYAFVTAPFDGRISRAELTVGNIVQTAPNAPVLATVVANDKLYAEFNVDERTYIKAIRTEHDPKAMPVELTLAGDEDVVYHGKIHSFDNQLDRASGTIRARAIFDNTDGVLTSGMYANVRLGSASKMDALLIPQKAIGTNQDKKFVYIVDQANTAVYREVNLGISYQDSRVVLSGLNVGDRVITNGIAHIRPNTVVNPLPLAVAQAPDVP
ncbi:MAG: efflux RND transporter periplasmic adaptor subunit [Gammaproteobacteria bacterium]|nr:efflux RND transporter periplasmic adaptor subunit [Gammaproteobacteria bacterium]